MATQKQTWGFLSGNALKIIAAAAMLADHVGLMFFPEAAGLRLIGRLAYPIFAYMIAEGCRYTRSRQRYFFHIFLLAVVCQVVYFLADGSLYMSILVTFSCSILVIYSLQELKGQLRSGSAFPMGGMVLFTGAVALTWLANRVLTIDYGFWGCMVPVFASIFQQRDTSGGTSSPLDRREVHVLMTGVGLLFLAHSCGGNQIWALLALPLLLCYSGQRGKLRMKYFFYIFYPLHLVLLQLISWIVF